MELCQWASALFLLHTMATLGCWTKGLSLITVINFAEGTHGLSSEMSIDGYR